MNLGQNDGAIGVYLKIYILASIGGFPEELRGQKRAPKSERKSAQSETYRML